MNPEFILKQVEAIRYWEGEGYQSFDEIGRALFEIEQCAKEALFNKPIKHGTPKQKHSINQGN